MQKVISIIEDDAAVGDALRMLLESEGHAVQLSSSAEHFLSCDDVQGDCIITDVCLPGISGMELQEELARRGDTRAIIVMTGHGDVPLAVKAMRAGALDFIEKPFTHERLLASVARALDGAGAARDRALEAKRARDLLALLTSRERDVMAKLAHGQPNKLVARELGISPRTVEVHRAKIMDKFAARNLSDIVRIYLTAVRHSA